MSWLMAVCILCGFAVSVSGADPPQAERVLQEAIALHQKGDFEGAVSGYRAYLKVRPDAVDARSNLGAALARLGRYEEAISEYRRALERDAQNPGVISMLYPGFPVDYKFPPYTMVPM